MQETPLLRLGVGMLRDVAQTGDRKRRGLRRERCRPTWGDAPQQRETDIQPHARHTRGDAAMIPMYFDFITPGICEGELDGNWVLWLIHQRTFSVGGLVDVAEDP